MKEARRIEFFFEIFRIMVALIAAFGFTLICIAFMTDEPIEAIKAFAFGPFSNLRRFGQMMGKFIPYLLVGSGMCFIYASNRFNMGGEGVYLLAGCMTAFIGVNLGENGLPHIVTVLLLMLVGAFIGGSFGLIPALMREKLNVNETVVSIMMNYGLMYLSTFLVKTLMVDPDISYLGSKLLPENMKLTILVERTNIHSGLFVGILAVLAVGLIFYRTSLGYFIRICGANPKFARTAGINMSSSLIIAQVLGLALCGLGGAIDIMGIYDRYIWAGFTNYGFDGMLVAVLSRKNPLLVPLGAFLLAYMRTGASILNYSTELPIEFVDIMQAILILLIAGEQFLAGFKNRIIFASSKAKNQREVAKG